MSRAEGFAAIPIWMVRDRSIKRSSLLVYASLSSRSGLGAIFPSQATIAQESGVSERTARDCLKELEALGVIERHTRRHGEGRSTSLTTSYSLHPGGRIEQPATSAGPLKLPATGSEATGNQQHNALSIEADRERQREKRRAHSLPADWTPTPAHRALAAERGVDCSLEAETFRAHAEANARKAVVWDAAFRQWLLKARPAAGAAAPAEVFPAGMEWMEFKR